MIMGILTVLWEKWVEFRRDFYKITLAAMIAPLLYILVFGLGIQTMSHGQSYLNFLIPGVVALTTMNGSFNAIAQNLNVQRLYEKAFDQVMISPTPLWQFIAGQVIGGSLRGLYAGMVIILLVLPIGTGLCFNGWSFLLMFLNGAVFSTIGVVVSFYAKNHADVPRFSNYVIMPMAYLCNTFFSSQGMPSGTGSLWNTFLFPRPVLLLEASPTMKHFPIQASESCFCTWCAFPQLLPGSCIRKRTYKWRIANEKNLCNSSCNLFIDRRLSDSFVRRQDSRCFCKCRK